MYREVLPQRLKKARLDAGYTQKQVEEITGISQAIISNIEKGNREPNIENLGILIDLYEEKASYILGTRN